MVARGTRAAMSDKPPAQRTWGGRFESKPAELMTRINASIGFDMRLWREDIAASKAHAAMLREQGILGEADAAAILEGLDQIAAEYERDGVPERLELEDIHMTVEHRLGELIGAAAGRLHTARSRNDQVATDRSEEHTSELQSPVHLVCRLLLEKKKTLFNLTTYHEKNGDERPISYRDMSVRHLGTLYEGLLELKFFITKKPTVVRVANGTVEFIPATQGGKLLQR